MTAVFSHGGSTVLQQPPGPRAGPARRRRSWLWWVSRWSLPLYRLRLGWLLGHRFMLITDVGRNPWLPADEDLQRLARSLGGVAFRPAATSRAARQTRLRKESEARHAA